MTNWKVYENTKQNTSYIIAVPDWAKCETYYITCFGLNGLNNALNKLCQDNPNADFVIFKKVEVEPE